MRDSGFQAYIAEIKTELPRSHYILLILYEKWVGLFFQSRGSVSPHHEFCKEYGDSCPVSNIPHTGHVLRIHDFRRGLAVENLRRWSAAGRNLLNLFPYLSAYMGHFDFGRHSIICGWQQKFIWKWWRRWRMHVWTLSRKECIPMKNPELPYYVTQFFSLT